MEEKSDGILLRPTGPTVEKLSWEDTAREMAASGEDWNAWEATVGDGLQHISWSAKDRVAEAPSPYRRRSRPAKRG